MRVSYETFHRHAIAALETASQRLLDLQRQVATGRRIDRASQDPAAAAAAVVERGRAATTDVYTAAGNSAESRLMVADTVLSDLGDQLTAAQVALTGVRGTTVTPAQREAYARQLESLRDARQAALLEIRLDRVTGLTADARRALAGCGLPVDDLAGVDVLAGSGAP